MATCASAEYAVFVLQANNIHIVDIKEVGCPAIRFDILFREFETDAVGVLVTFSCVIDGNGDTGYAFIVGRNCFTQIGGKGRDAAPSRQIVANESYAADS